MNTSRIIRAATIWRVLRSAAYVVARVARTHAADALAVVGVGLIGMGVQTISPTATWFYAGAVCLIAARIVMRAESG